MAGRRFFLIASLVVGLQLLGILSSHAAEKYPTRAITLICPFSPGGTTDLWARLTAEFLKKKWGVPVNVVNKTGGGGVPANLEVYQAKPDGYTMLTDNQSSCPFQEIAIKDLPYKTLDRTFVAMVAITADVMFCSTKFPWKDLKDLAEEVKKDPENFTWATTGPGGASDVHARLFFKSIGVDVAKTKPVIGKGMGELNQMVAGGHIKMGQDAAPSAHPFVKGGLVRALSITRKMPHLYPDVKTPGEQGFPLMDTKIWWWGISGPPNLPSHIIEAWHRTLRELVNDPEYVEKIKNSGGLIEYREGEEFRKWVEKEIQTAKELYGVK
ncbi:MAG: tripartite tricarboxylate transporter substrate binding protein [Candidatus Methanosuratincola sp.]